MIELVVEGRCNGCQACVDVCPRNVFEVGPDGRALIARQADCQTCFLCELYCPVDALYVAPEYEQARTVDAGAVLASGLLGQYRRDSGWGEWAATVPNEHWRMGQIFERARAMAAAVPEKTPPG